VQKRAVAVQVAQFHAKSVTSIVIERLEPAPQKGHSRARPAMTTRPEHSTKRRAASFHDDGVNQPRQNAAQMAHPAFSICVATPGLKPGASSSGTSRIQVMPVCSAKLTVPAPNALSGRAALSFPGSTNPAADCLPCDVHNPFQSKRLYPRAKSRGGHAVLLIY
jgi:hypothetical protein